MKNKYFLILLNIIITILSLYFTYTLFESYKEDQQKNISAYLDQRVKVNKSFIKNAFITIQNEIQSNEKVFLQIHQEALKILREDKNTDINLLKQKLSDKYLLINIDFHLFYLDKNYIIKDSTYIKDIGFDLSLVPDARVELDSSNKDNKVHQSSTISIDIINSDIKSYSYSKVNDSFYLELGFINHNVQSILKKTMKKIQTMTNSRSQLYRIEQKLDDTEYYDNILVKKTGLSKEEYIKNLPKFHKNKNTKNLIIKSNREGKILKRYLNDAIIFYIPLIKKHNKYMKVMGDFVLELYIDMHYEKELEQHITFYYYIFIFIHLIFLVIIYFFTKKYHSTQLALKKEMKIKVSVLEENKEFIIIMAEHMRTPLSVIMNNFSFFEKSLSNKFKKYLTQVNSAIHMLKNSHDDLEYLSMNKQLTYKSSSINLNKFVQNRIDFFTSILEIQNQTISYSFDTDIHININEIELERLIDNNISNAIKYSNENSSIIIQLAKTNNKYCLSFASKSKAIQNKQKIFSKNHQENYDGKRSLGLGLYMVKEICLKYDILYEVCYEEGMNIFKYYLKE